MINYWIELKRFLSDYKKILILGSILVSVIFVSVFALGRFLDSGDQEVEEANEPSKVIDEYIESERSYFSILVEDEEGSLFVNNALINEYFRVDSVLSELESNTGIDIIEKQERLIELEIADSINLINVVKNDSSGVLTAYFNLGSERENVQAADFFYSMIMENQIEFLNNKYVFEIAEPTLELSEQNEETIDIQAVNNNWIDILVFIISNAVIGFIVGMIIVLGIVLLKVLVDKHLKYMFTYDTSDNDKFMLYDQELQNDTMIKQFINLPVVGKRRIISEHDLDNTFIQTLLNKGNEDVSASDSLERISDLENTGVVILIIFPNITTRRWYKKQIDLVKLYDLPIRIIQYNE